MVSRVVYGMANQKAFPAVFGKINRKTQTPIVATVTVTIITLILAVSFPLVQLAEFTSEIILVIWILINVSLIVLKLREKSPIEGTYTTSIWMPILGAIFGLSLLLLSLFL